MIHVKNVRLSKLLEENTLFKIYENKSSFLNHLKILESTMYVFIHEAERVDANSKSIKFSSRAQKETLCEYDEEIIYRVFLKKNYKMIRAKDLRIYENVNAKEHTELLAYDAIMKETDVSLLSNKSNDITVVKRSRERFRKNANLIQALTVFSNSAFIESSSEYFTEDDIVENSLILLVRLLTTEETTISVDDIDESQTYRRAMKCEHFAQ